MSGMFPPSLGSVSFFPVVTLNCAPCSGQVTMFPESAPRKAGARVVASIVNSVESSVDVGDQDFPVIHLNMFHCTWRNFVNLGDF